MNTTDLKKAIVINAYGSPDVVELKEVAKPAIKDDEVLVRVHAASLNAGDVFALRGSPWLVRLSIGLNKPKNYILGWDMAGVVEAVGQNVTRFHPGDEVFASCKGSLAEYVSIAENKLAPKPDNLTFKQAAAVPTAAVTAILGLRDAGKIQPGQKVLINGASGGVGTFAVQIAKAFGAEVTGVCSTRNVDLVRSIGADHVVDYTREDFKRNGQRYDLILDNVASRSFSEISDDSLLLPNAVTKGYQYAEDLISQGHKIGAVAFYWRSWPEEHKYRVGLTLSEKMFVNHGMYIREAIESVGWIDEEHYQFTMQMGYLCLRLWQKGYEIID